MGLKREDILAGRIEQQIIEAERRGLIARLPPEQRQASKRQIMKRIGDDEVWVFGYGSLMWNPCIHYIDRQPGLLRGYHRSFCLCSTTGRGSPEQPGLMLALKPGGSCRGVALRIAAEVADAELGLIWDREMISGAYRAKLLPVQTPLGPRPAIVFVINRDNPRYMPDIAPAAAAAMIAEARGWLGSCAEYLYSTVEHLDQLGIKDAAMRELARRVREQQI